MRTRKVYKTTSNRSVYNRARKWILERDWKIHCGYCKYHRNENLTDSTCKSHRSYIQYGYKVNWKRLRKTQYK